MHRMAPEKITEEGGQEPDDTQANRKRRNTPKVFCGKNSSIQKEDGQFDHSYGKSVGDHTRQRQLHLTSSVERVLEQMRLDQSAYL